MPAEAKQPHVHRCNRQPFRVQLNGGVELQRDVAGASRGEYEFDTVGISGQRRVGLRDGAVTIRPREDRPAEQGRELGRRGGLGRTESRHRAEDNEDGKHARHAATLSDGRQSSS
jgi:hypothetical protein